MKKIILSILFLLSCSGLLQAHEPGKLYAAGSSDLSKVLYEDKTQTLTIQYRSKRVTEYYVVPR